MREIIIEVPDDFGESLEPHKENCTITGEIVRCMDCKYNERGMCENDNIRSHIVGSLFSVYGDWFCAYGERR